MTRKVGMRLKKKQQQKTTTKNNKNNINCNHVFILNILFLVLARHKAVYVMWRTRPQVLVFKGAKSKVIQ